MPATSSATWSLEMYKNGTKIQEVSESLFFGNLTQDCRNYNILNEGFDDITVEWEECSTGIFRTRPIRSGADFDICARNYEVFGNAYTVTPGSVCGNYITPGGSTTQVSTLTINNGYEGNSNYNNFTINDEISFKLRLVNSTSSNITASLATLDNGFVSIGSLALSTGYSNVICPYVSSTTTSSISFTTGLSSFYGDEYYFAPNPTTGSISSLYDEYGDVDYAFNPKPYDILVLYLSDGSILEYTISSINLIGGQLILNLDAQLSELAKSNLTGNSYRRFLLLSRQKDETNVILNFTKRDGKTSYGFLIADNISSNILANIDTITKEVKQKLLNDQSIISDINGGTFGP
jgi:hypothetical protein